MVSGIGAATAAAQPRDKSQVEIHLYRLTEAKQELHQLLEILEQRLEPILRSVPPQQSDPSGNKAAQTLVGLASRIASDASDVEAATHRVRSFIDRLEL